MVADEADPVSDQAGMGRVIGGIAVRALLRKGDFGGAPVLFRKVFAGQDRQDARC